MNCDKPRSSVDRRPGRFDRVVGNNMRYPLTSIRRKHNITFKSLSTVILFHELRSTSSLR